LAGALTLDKVFRDRPLDFMLLCSSITGTIGGAGQVGYCAANAFLDAFAEQRSRQRPEPTVAIAWGRWQGVGLARLFESWHASRTGATLEGGMSAEQGIDALERILHHRVGPRVAVMNTEWRGDPAAPTMDQPPALAATAPPPTPETPTTFAGSPLERQLADIWQQLLGTPRFDRHTRFQELGGDSLVGIQLIGRIKEQLGVQLPIRSIFDHPTIAAQAECIAATTSAIEEGEL
jgi:acyl carrier protein